MNRSLVEAARTGDVEYLLRLIAENPLLLETVGLGGAETPLHIASLCGHLDFVKKILELKSQFANELNQDGYTPLHLASVNGHVEIVVEFLKLGKDLCTIQGKEQWIPLHFAVVKGRSHVVKELLSSCPESVGMKTARGETALHLAVKSNQFGSLGLLVDHLIQKKMETVLNEKDNQGNTILHLAVLRKQYEVVNLLLSDAVLKNGVLEVNSKNESGLVPLDILLQFQSEAGDIEIETTLLKAGAMRSSDMTSSFKQEHCQFSSRTEELEDFFKYKKGRDKPSDVRTALLTVAALILAATYQAALSPPSGLGQDNEPPATPPQNTERSYLASSPVSSPIIPRREYKYNQTRTTVGKSVLAKRTPAVFILFLFCNSIGFYTAGYTILFLTRGFPMQLEFQFSMLALGITYATAMQGIIPGTKTLIAFSLLSTLFPILLPFILRQVRRMYYRSKKYYPRNDTP